MQVDRAAGGTPEAAGATPEAGGAPSSISTIDANGGCLSITPAAPYRQQCVTICKWNTIGLHNTESGLHFVSKPPNTLSKINGNLYNLHKYENTTPRYDMGVYTGYPIARNPRVKTKVENHTFAPKQQACLDNTHRHTIAATLLLVLGLGAAL